MQWSGTQWRVAALALLTAVVAVAVIGSMTGAPYADAGPAASRLEEELRLAVLPAPAPATYLREERFQRGDTLSGFLARLGIAEAQAARLARVPAMRQLRAGTTVDAEVSAEGAP